MTIKLLRIFALTCVLLLSCTLIIGCGIKCGGPPRGEEYVTDAGYLHSGTVEGGNYPERGEPVRWFVAEVIDNLGGQLLVRAHEDSWESYDQIYVTTTLYSGETVSGFKAGDVIRITYDGTMAESYPPQIFTVYGIEHYTTDVPDDFSFSLTWGVFGISSYDSQSGKLVKTTDATNPEDYVTNYTLTDKEMAFVCGLITALDVYSYPDVYDPGNGMSEPCATLILTVRVDDEEKTIKAEDISLFYRSDDAKGQAFLDTCLSISKLLTQTDEWKALPDYEHLYE